MKDFSDKNGEIKILISTTVIEVGIDIQDATIIVIENPERFGLSQIHQLRGRVGRGEKQSYCVLFYEKLGENFRKRLDILKNTNDGFVIAEEDLKLRGSGEILGLRQSGEQGNLIANYSNHYHLLLEASKMARNIVKNKKFLKEEIAILLKMFGYEDCLNEKILN
jgi:ATP-dependent DNA helicase RecG